MSRLIGTLLAPGRRFGALLVSLALLMYLPLVLPPRLSAVLVPILFSVVLLSALWAVSESRRHFLVGAPFALVGTLASVTSVFVESQLLTEVSRLTLIVFLAIVAVMILSYVLRARAVDLGIVLGAVCVYLVFALMWGLAYELLWTQSPSAFAVPQGSDTAESFMYFSFVTITTLGYGDITPRSGFARVLSVTEAMVGQLYLVVLVARLVGLYTARQATDLGQDPSRTPSNP